MRSKNKQKTGKQKSMFNSLVAKIILHFVIVVIVPLLLTTWLTLQAFGSLQEVITDPIQLTHITRIKAFSVGSGLLTIVLISAVAYFTTQFITRRLLALKNAADEMAKGNLEYRLKTDEVIENELSEIYSSFNVMSGFIGDSQNNLNSAVEKLERALLKEKELSELKSKFITVISHQLRTPVSAIRGNLELILAEEGRKLDDEQKTIIENTYKNNLRLIGTIDDLVMVLDIEKRSLTLRPSDIDPIKIVKKAIKEYKEDAKEKKLKITLKLQKNKIPHIQADAYQLNRILNRLLENAIFYNEGNGEIVISIKLTKEKEIVFSVNDIGIGIPDKDKKAIASKFFRGSNAALLHADGSGLGLFITKHLVEASEGRFWFESKKGKGSTFYFSIPILTKIK
ncbi:MAG: HAMP domain-containing sensor histidine kinase [Candidatus Peregrinibacteria bacterium]|nr:HAMP domain-containing sensor histidine kinase [Candidatus Peregrinibacteria bacterium]MDZ4244389.1 HAMP domain-containing sensor histidine kinase [Candidatus Gracilibacteria bacterium]